MRRYAFINANLLDGTDDMHVKHDSTVLVEGDRIVGISQGVTGVPRGYRKIDLTGSYLLPGLVNMHVHLAGTGEPKEKPGDVAKTVKRITGTAIGRAFLHRLVKGSVRNQLYSGVTTLRSVGEVGLGDLYVRNLVNHGKAIGPRMLVAGDGVTPPNGHAANIMAKVCETPDDAVALVDDMAAAGVDLIKLFITGGVYDATVKGEPGVVRMSQEMADAATAEARAKGLPTAAHVESTEGVRMALKAGVNTIEHGAHLDDEIIALFKEKGSSLTTTLSAGMPMAKLPPEVTKTSDIVRFNANVVFDGIAEASKQALVAGIPVGLGTDSACPFISQYDMWREVVSFARYVGVSNAFALHTATQVNARLLGVGEVTGSIELGKCADMIVVDENPLDNLGALATVRTVMARGTLFEHPSVRHVAKIDEQLETIF